MDDSVAVNHVEDTGDFKRQRYLLTNTSILQVFNIKSYIPPCDDVRLDFGEVLGDYVEEFVFVCCVDYEPIISNPFLIITVVEDDL